MPSTLRAARASNPEPQSMIRHAVQRRGLPVGALRIEAHPNRDAWVFTYPGYAQVTITGQELLQAGDPQAFIDARVDDMLRLPLV